VKSDVSISGELRRILLGEIFMTETNVGLMISAIIKVFGSKREFEAIIEATSEGIIEGSVHCVLDKIVKEKKLEATEERLKTSIGVTIKMISDEVAEDIVAREIEGMTKEKIEEMLNNIRGRLQIRFKDAEDGVPFSDEDSH